VGDGKDVGDDTGDAAKGGTEGAAQDTTGAGKGKEAAAEEPGDKTPADEDAETTYTEEEPEPTPQREEAIRILADLVELQESSASSWHVPQSASRSELPSLQP
jgi:hypothetical protein